MIKNEHGEPILRFSLFSEWWTNPNSAMAKYFPEIEPRSTNKFMAFGSKVDDALGETPMPDWVKDIPTYPLKQHQIVSSIDGVWVRGSLDSYDPDAFKFLDNKCAMVKPLKNGGWSAHSWTQDKVNKHEQLVFYSTLVQYEYGWVDDECHISVVPYYEDKWETMRRVQGLNLYDPKYFIPRIVSQKERDDMMDKIIITSKDIIKNYNMWCKLHEISETMYEQQ